jgi:hypothetical protein
VGTRDPQQGAAESYLDVVQEAVSNLKTRRVLPQSGIISARQDVELITDLKTELAFWRHIGVVGREWLLGLGSRSEETQ